MKKIVLKCLQLQAQMRILHWQTTSFAEHNAFGTFYTAADVIIDRLVEAISGKYERFLLGNLESVVGSDYGMLKTHMFIVDMDTFFKVEIYNCGVDKENDDEIVNIIQELRGELDKLKYLLSLK